MKTTLTREELLEAKNAFNCEEWVNPIQDILDSSDSETIEIEDKYLVSIKNYADWEQITFCKALNLDLKWNIPEEARNFVFEKIKSCEIVINGKYTYYEENGETIFFLDSENKRFWFQFDEIYKVLVGKFSLKFNEIRELMNTILEEHLKLDGYMALIANILRDL